MASQAAEIPSISSQAGASSTSASVNTSASDAASKPKPCCVCKDEKSRRDECMLFSSASDPAKECKSTIEQYRSCMLGFGFKV